MKYFNKKNILLSLTVLVGYLSLHNAAGEASVSGYNCTGAPTASTCGSAAAGCHNQSPGTLTPTVTMQLLSGATPVTGYTPNTTYTLSVTINSLGTNASTRYGFQAMFSPAGIWGVAPVGFQETIVGPIAYMEQSSSQVNNFMDVPWTSPPAGSGSVTFYASGLIADNNGLPTGDNFATGSLVITEGACTNPVITDTIGLIHCYNGTDGSINLGVTGGNPPFTYSWTGPNGFTSTSQNLTNLSSGTYAVTVTGGLCSSTLNIAMVGPTDIVLGDTSAVTICEGNMLNIPLTVTGGAGFYNFAWTGPNGYTANVQNPFVPPVSVADQGTYSVIVTDANGCTKTANVQVNVNPGIILQADVTNPTCNGVDNGSINMFVSGSAPGPYTFSWSGPNGFTGNTQSIANLAGGSYTLTANTDPASACSATYTATLATPATIVVGASANNTPICFGSPLSLSGSGSGGTSPLVFRWTGPSGYFSQTQNPTVSSAANYNESGIYTLAVTDANNCSASAVVTVAIDTVPTITTTELPALCFGAATGGINVTATNGTNGAGPFTYSYSGPNGYTATTQNVTNIPAGTYTVAVTTAAGCTGTKTAIVSQPASGVTGVAASNTPICNNGVLNLFGTGSGGTGALSYSWTGPNGFTSSLQNPTISSATSVNTGVYTLAIKDVNNCSFVSTTTVALSVQPVVTATVTNPTCFGYNNGSISTQVVGGAPPFTYVWTGPNGYTSGAQNPTNLATGVYAVSVTGICVGVGNTTVFLAQPPALVDSVYGNNPVCAGTLLNLASSVTGGTGNYSYAWTGPNNFVSTDVNPVIQTATTSAGGQYTLVVRDANNCIKATQYNVTVDTVPVVHLKDTGYCPGATVTLDAGNSGAAYKWTTGATTQTIDVGTTGTYGVIVTNLYDCPASQSIQVSARSKPSVDSFTAVMTANNPGGFNFTAMNPQFVNTYVWDYGDGTTFTGGPSSLHYYAATGTYSVRLFTVNECGVDTVGKQVVVLQVTGVPNITSTGGDNINVYPNPTRDYTVIENTGGPALKSVKVVNVLGVKVYEGAAGNQQSFKLNTGSFVPGIYTLYIETSAGISVRKLEVMKQ